VQQAAEADRQRTRALNNFSKFLERSCAMLLILERKPWADRIDLAETRRIFREDALQGFREVLASRPTDPNGQMELASGYLFLGMTLHALAGQRTEAQAAMRQAVAILERLESEREQVGDYWHHRATAHHIYGHWLAYWRDAEAARAQFRKARHAYERNLAQDRTVRNLNNLAWLLAMCPCAELREPARAVELAREAFRLEPNKPPVWNTLAAAFYRAGQPRQAEEVLRKSIELHAGGEGMDWFLLALVLWDHGQKAEARRWYDQAARWMDELTPDHIELRNFRREVAGVLGQERREPAKGTKR
jgi:tetratricopeptide (TPR) repeat protein